MKQLSSPSGERADIGQNEILESVEKVLLGPERRGRVISDLDKKTTAYHEAGHAVVGYLLPNCDPVRKVSIISRGRAGGYTLKMPTEDRHYHTLAQFKDELAMSLGGYVVEKLIFGADQLSTGPSSDLKNATHIAHEMIVRYGMSDKLGPRTFGDYGDNVFLGGRTGEERDYSEKTSEQIDEEVKRLMVDAEKLAHHTVTNNKEKLEKMVAVLLEKETIEQEEIEKVMGVSQQNKKSSGGGIEVVE